MLFIAALLVEEGKALVDALGGGLPPWAEAEVSLTCPFSQDLCFSARIIA